MRFVRFLSIVIFLLINDVTTSARNHSNYMLERNKLIADERGMAIGSRIILNEKEKIVNKVLMRHKHDELKAAFQDEQRFLPALNFLDAATAISRSKVFGLLKRMPKGAVLHAHISAITSRDFILRNITHRPHLYVCRQESLKLRFLNESAARARRDCHWELLSKARLRDRFIDREIAEALSMYTKNRGEVSSDGAWTRFLSIFYFLKSLITYRPVYEDFLYHILEELHEDNVQFVEVRTPFSILYELNGNQHGHLQVVRIYNKVVNRFIKDHPDFVGVKWIYSPQRNVPLSKFGSYLKKFRALQKAHPSTVVGFDLVGQEDKGRPLKAFAKELQNLRKETRFFFHAGETNWYGQETDENLIDAVLLNATRIGHGYALVKHPKLMELVKQRGIAIEISPISNQVLRLVKDLRNHPASHFFSRDLPVVVSSDDPGFWNARALSYDFYEAFVGIMSARADLRALKQLALNSIMYSSGNDAEKHRLMKVWSKRWSQFVDEVADEEMKKNSTAI